MKHETLSSTRRNWILGTSAAIGGSLVAAQPSKAAEPEPAPRKKIRYCLNMGTIRGQELSLEAEVDAAGKAGYDAIEPWMGKIHKFVEAGGSLKDIRTRVEDFGMTVESAIGFAQWIVDDDAKRAKGLEVAKRDLDTLAQMGAKRLAAPPVGATKEPGLDLFEAAKRYRTLLELGDQFGVVPMVEVWGFSANLSRLGESVFVAIESGHAKACLLPDFYHIYKGGSDFAGLSLLGPNAIQVFHCNDYPDIPKEQISDKDRVYPGDGICPLPQIMKDMAGAGIYPVLSLELFNRTYWKQPALEVAKTGLAKMQAMVAEAGLA
jgi:2-keto-myo-inositol isomerase